MNCCKCGRGRQFKKGYKKQPLVRESEATMLTRMYLLPHPPLTSINKVDSLWYLCSKSMKACAFDCVYVSVSSARSSEQRRGMLKSSHVYSSKKGCGLASSSLQCQHH